MTKAAKNIALASADLLQSMIPGDRYELTEIMKRSGVNIAIVKASLAKLLSEKVIRTTSVRQRFVYWRPTEEELGQERQNPQSTLQLMPTLTGYDASLRQLQELSMLARPRPMESGAPENRVARTSGSTRKARRKAGKSDGSSV